MFRQLVLSLATAGFLAGATVVTPAQEVFAQAQACLTPDAARAEVQGGAAVAFSRFRGEVAAQAGGEILSADLCRLGDRLVYLVSVLVGGRSVVNLTVDAQTGAILR